MQTNPARWITTAIVLTLATTSSLHAQSATNYEPGQTVEVREGDTWSKASVAAREGRRYQIKYDDGTQEWVTADRLRVASAAAAGPSTKPAAPKPIAWKNGDEVEVKWGGLWSKARIVNRRGEWLMVEYAQGKWIEWVEPWRIRKVGSTEDVPYASPNPHIKKSDPPPREKPGAAPESEKPTNGSDAFAPAPFSFPVAPADVNSAKKIALGGEAKWQYVPAVADPIKLARPLPTQGPLHVGASPVAIDVSGTKAMIGYVLDGVGGKGTSVEILDLTSGKSTQTKLDTATRPLALMPDGRRIIARAHGFFGGTKHRLDVWEVGAVEAKHVISFVPHPRSDGKDNDINDVFVIDDTRVITSGGSSLTCWEVGTAQAIWTLATADNAVVAQSPDRRRIAIATRDSVELLDAASGESIGAITKDVPPVGALAFSPSGARVFGSTTGGGVVTFDLEKGEARPTIAVSQATRMQPLSDQLVDVGVALVDVDRGSLVARLERPNLVEARVIGGSLVALQTTGKAAALTAWKLPLAEVEQLAASAKSAEAVRLADGASVSLDVAFPVDESQAEAVRRDLRASLEKAGAVVVDGAPTRIVARVEDGKSEERMYESRFSIDRERLKVTVTEKITRLWIESNGKNVWEIRQSAWPSMMVDRKEGQSIQDAVQAASKPQVDFLRRVALPRTILLADESELRTLKLDAGRVR